MCICKIINYAYCKLTFSVYFSVSQGQICDGQKVSRQTDRQTVCSKVPAETPAERRPATRNSTRGGRAGSVHIQQPHRQPVQSVRNQYRNDIVTRTVSTHVNMIQHTIYL